MAASPPQRRIDVAAISSPYNTIAQELFRADGLTISSNSDTVTLGTKNQAQGALGNGYVDVSAVQGGLLIVSVASATGTSPTLAMFFDVQDYYGNWVQVSNTATTGLTTVAITGAGVYAGNITAGPVLPLNGRIRWTIGGTTPQFNSVSLNLFGR